MREKTKYFKIKRSTKGFVKLFILINNLKVLGLPQKKTHS